MKNIINNISQQIRKNGRLIGIIYIPLLVFILFLGIQPYANIHNLVNDVHSITDVGRFTGFISDVGIYLWLTSAVICYFTASLLFHFLDKRTETKFLIAIGTYSLFLMMDDRLMLHEWYEKIAFPIIVFSIISILFMFRKYLAQQSYIVLAIGLGFLAFGLGVDVFKEMILSKQAFAELNSTIANSTGITLDRIGDIHNIVEDGPKFIGIAGWTSFLVHLCYQELRSIIKHQ